MLASTLSAIIGAILLISITLPWFLIGVVCISIIYIYAAIFYRASARELKVSILLVFIAFIFERVELQRLDAILRSSLYSHFSESLSGLATIRAYGESERFRKDNEHRVDMENRYVVTPLRFNELVLIWRAEPIGLRLQIRYFSSSRLPSNTDLP